MGVWRVRARSYTLTCMAFPPHINTPSNPLSTRYPLLPNITLGLLTGGTPTIESIESIDHTSKELQCPRVVQRWGPYLDDGRNSLVLAFLNRSTSDYLLMLDDDIQFTPDDVRALYHYASTRNSHWTSGQYANIDADQGQVVCAYTLDTIPEDDRATHASPMFALGETFTPIPLNDAPTSPTFVASVGAGFMLISRDFLIRMRDHTNDIACPWFIEPVLPGHNERDVHLGEDHGFAWRAHQLSVLPMLAPVAVKHLKRVVLVVPAIEVLAGHGDEVQDTRPVVLPPSVAP